MLILEENFRRHLEAFASELFICVCIQTAETLLKMSSFAFLKIICVFRIDSIEEPF